MVKRVRHVVKDKGIPGRRDYKPDEGSPAFQIERYTYKLTIGTFK